MKTNLMLALPFVSLFATAGFTQQIPVANTVAGATPRVSFVLKNTLGYHRLFRVEGPGIAYGFTMTRHETVPCNWPVGSTLSFSTDGEAKGGLILTVAATDEGKTLTTGTGVTDGKPVVVAVAPVLNRNITVMLHNPSLLPRKIALVSYEPGEPGNGTNIFIMGPKGTKSFRFPVGTKLYTADSEQVDVVMSGKRIDSGKPFLTITKEDAGKSFDVN